MNYWLLKSEPSVFGIDDLARAPRRTTAWEGVRNFQARNFLRDAMKKGDRALFYHSSCAVPGVAGMTTIVRAGYPDGSAFDPDSEYFDPGSSAGKPTWYAVDVRLDEKFDPPIDLETLRQHSTRELKDLLLLRRGNRLSVTPVARSEWDFILSLRSAPQRVRTSAKSVKK
jgi:predicted RNA-binding protein with PUA-like domain